MNKSRNLRRISSAKSLKGNNNISITQRFSDFESLVNSNSDNSITSKKELINLNSRQSLPFSTDFSPPLASSNSVKETKTMSVDYDPSTGYKMLNQYVFIKELGRGCHGKVKLCLDVETNELYAVKIVSKVQRKKLIGNKTKESDLSDVMGYKIQREIAILKKCQHQNVVRLREVIDAESSLKIYLILEYMDGGGLEFCDKETQKPLHRVEKVKRIMRDVVLGLEYLHHQRIVHRDIKPANLLISQSHTIVKISDFGVSYSCQLAQEGSLHKTKPDDQQGSMKEPSMLDQSTNESVDEFELAKTVGTPAFFAPELCWSETNKGNRTKTRPKISKAIDIWALGITLYCFVYGKCPFFAKNEYELFEIIPRKKAEFIKYNGNNEKISNELIQLMQGLMEKDPAHRMEFNEIKNNKWLLEGIKDKENWLIENDVKKHITVEVSEHEVKCAVTLKNRIRDHIKKFSKRISAFFHSRT